MLPRSLAAATVLLPNRCYRSELLCEAPSPAVLNGALSHSRECRNLTLLSPCVATRQPRSALTFRAELGICGRRLQTTRADPYRSARLSPTLSGKPQNPTDLHASARTQSLHQRTTLHPRGSPFASEAKAAHLHFPSPSFPSRPFGPARGLDHGTSSFGFTRYHQTRFGRALMDDWGRTPSRTELAWLDRPSQPFG